MDCIFCKIIAGEIPSYKIYENSDYLVFMDAFPSMIGQTLVIPKKHRDGYLFDFEDSDYIGLMKMGKKVAKAMDSSLNTLRTGMIVEGLDVNHVHLRMYPLMKGGITLEPLKIRPSPEEMQAVANKISAKINN